MVDIIELKKELLTEAKINNIKKRALLITTDAAVASAGITLINTPPLKVLMGLLGVKNIMTDISIIDKETNDNIKLQIHNKIRKTNTYKQGQEEYLNYLYKLSDFFKNYLKITDSIVVAELFNLMLNNGLLSCNKKYKYKNFQRYAENELYELSGMQISTGKGVCRHNVSLLQDLEATLDNNAYFCLCAGIENEKHMKKYSKKIIQHLNHATLLIESDNAIFNFDPTTNNFSRIRIGINKNQEYFHSMNKDGSLILFNKECIAKRKLDNEDNLKEFKDKLQKNLQNQKEDTKEYNTAKIKIAIGDTIYDSHQEEFMNFYIDTKEQLCRMKEVYEELVPLTNQKIKKYVIR